MFKIFSVPISAATDVWGAVDGAGLAEGYCQWNTEESTAYENKRLRATALQLLNVPNSIGPWNSAALGWLIKENIQRQVMEADWCYIDISGLCICLIRKKKWVVFAFIPLCTFVAQQLWPSKNQLQHSAWRRLCSCWALLRFRHQSVLPSL